MRITVLGMGNVLLRDEGVGVHVVRLLQQISLPEGVDVIESGTSPSALYLAEGCEKLIIVDAAQGGDRPGTIYRLRLQDLAPKGDSMLTSHEFDLFQGLLATNPQERPQEVVIIGVEPKEIGWGLELSPEVAERLGEVCQVVVKECN